MHVRFAVNDANPQSTVEAGIDAVRIHKTGCFELCTSAPGDLNADDAVDGLDVPEFVMAMIEPPYYAACADIAAPIGALDDQDVAAFVEILLAE
jgi:hypothetical protein